MKKITISVIVGVMLLGGVAFAQTTDLPSPGILPGSPFFFVERLFERVGNAFTFGEAAKAERALKVGEKRLAAARVLAERGDVENTEWALGLYKEKMEEASVRAQNSENVNVLERVTEATGKHFSVLEGVIEQVPEQAKEFVRKALEFSRQGQESALEALEKAQKAQEMRPDTPLQEKVPSQPEAGQEIEQKEVEQPDVGSPPQVPGGRP